MSYLVKVVGGLVDEFAWPKMRRGLTLVWMSDNPFDFDSIE